MGGVKTFGMSQILPTFDSLPTLVGPAGTQIAVNGVPYTSDGKNWRSFTAPAIGYIPLWWSSGASANTTKTTASQAFLVHGTSAPQTSVTTSNPLHVLDSTWGATIKFALEAWLANNGAVAFAQLYDVTAGSLVANTQISTNSGSFTPVRSTAVTLTPGHAYSVTIWSSNSSNTTSCTDVSLVAILS